MNKTHATIGSRFRFDIAEVMCHLNNTIFGQEHVLKKIENILKIIKIDLTSPERPLYIALFLGPTGVGKTEIARVLSEVIHGKKDAFCRVDMNTLSMEHYAASLTGAPPGYVGSSEGSSILDKELVEGSFSKPGIVLFDEIEKASSTVIQTLLNVFDNGVMRLTSGEKEIDFTNTIIIMTSNLGAKDIYQVRQNKPFFMVKNFLHILNPFNWNEKKGTLLEKIIWKKINQTFTPEFQNRIDDVIIFNWLHQEALLKVIDRKIGEINKRIYKHKCKLKLEEDAKRLIIKKAHEPFYGARSIIRGISNYVELPLAEYLIKEAYNPQFSENSGNEFVNLVGKKEKENIAIK